MEKLKRDHVWRTDSTAFIFAIDVRHAAPSCWTRLSDASSLSKHQEKQWSRTPDSLKVAYDYSYLTSTKQNTQDLFSWVINSNINDVIDVMEDAVSHKYPPYYYRPG
ncbi:hypothetical protein X975_25990, partial [Stegodyphus mimosarum]